MKVISAACIVVMIGLAALGVACNPSSAASPPVKILPEQCNVPVNGTIGLTLAGSLQGNPAIQWEATGGLIRSTGSGFTAELSAPSTSGEVVVTARITGSTTLTVTRACVILAADTSTPEMTPTPTATPILEQTVIISEVMANPCGSDDFKKWNEYVELYNYGDYPVDVGGLWLYDPGETGTPDQIVAWEDRLPATSLPAGLTTDSTVIPPRGFAVILSPLYTQGSDPYRMPYRFPAGVLVLTIEGSERLGDDLLSIVGEGRPDFVVLYEGGFNSVSKVISSYGGPSPARYPYEFDDPTPFDHFPLLLHDCSSAERIDPRGPDVAENWYEVRNGGSPGSAPYPPP
ncbi:MAG: lamin tail domain-containing protein [Anaerolineales bacterium]